MALLKHIFAAVAILCVAAQADDATTVTDVTDKIIKPLGPIGPINPVPANITTDDNGASPESPRPYTFDSADTKLRDLIKYFVQGLKGFVLGFQQGIVGDERIRLSEKCFSSDGINNDLMFMADFVSMKRPMWDAIRFTTTARDMLVNEMENCRWTSTIELLQEYCHSHDYEDDESDGDDDNHVKIETQTYEHDWQATKKKRCTTSKMITNFYMRYFNFVGMYIKVATIYAEWAPKNTNDCFLQMIAAGREFGKGIRILFEFHLTDESKEEIRKSVYRD